ncbi:MAG: glycosyltransferase family 39 protein [Candidatus Rokuibacteriota bacterium]
MRLISAASALLLAYLIWGSRDWPLIHDAPLMHYIAWLIEQGGVPYRDAFDMNLPGVYLLHLAVLRWAGPGDLAWRLFDLGWLAVICGLLVLYCRRIGDGWAPAGAALLFALYHLSGGAWHAGQRDFLLCLFLLLGVWGVARGTEQGASGALLWGGLALGAAMTVKPHAALLWVLCVVIAARDRSWALSAWGAAGRVIAAGLLVPAVVFGWLVWRGGLWPFLDIFTGYVVPLYSRVGRASAWQAIEGHAFGWPLIVLLLTLTILALLSPPPQEPARKFLALVGVLYGLVHFVAQGKGWEYQLYPLILFCCALVPTVVVSGRSAQWPRVLDLFGARRPIALAVWGLLVIVLGAKGVAALDAAWIAEKARRVTAITRDLQPLASPGATVQVMDTTSGGIHALLRLGLKQPTRFIYDFHLFHDVDDPRIEALRAEFLGALGAGPPAAILVLEESWPVPGYGRLDTFPALRRRLEQSYLPAVDGAGYRIYAKRRDP